MLIIDQLLEEVPDLDSSFACFNLQLVSKILANLLLSRLATIDHVLLCAPGFQTSVYLSLAVFCSKLTF